MFYNAAANLSEEAKIKRESIISGCRYDVEGQESMKRLSGEIKHLEMMAKKFEDRAKTMSSEHAAATCRERADVCRHKADRWRRKYEAYASGEVTGRERAL